MKKKIEKLLFLPILLTVALLPLATDVWLAILKDGLIPFWRVGFDLVLGLIFSGILSFLLDED